MINVEEVRVPDIGDFHDVDVIEVLVKAGDHVETEDSLITLESEKATMEVPAPKPGTIKNVAIKIGDKVSAGSLIANIETEAAETPTLLRQAPPAEEPKAIVAPPQVGEEIRPPPVALEAGVESMVKAHASPSVRRFARELGADLGRISGSGPKGRILKEDVQAYVKSTLGGIAATTPGVTPLPEIDFGQYGEIEARPLTQVQRVSAANVHRSWLNIPLVTQFGEADMTDLEAFRKSQTDKLKEQGVRLSPLAFFVKASIVALQHFPAFNASLSVTGEQLILKKYFHIGVAVDTPHGLVVPVIRDADRLGLIELARTLTDVAEKARNRKLTPQDMQGGCFTISSLGGIGGTAFTPIVNAPEAAILGVSRARMQPIYRNGAFEPRLMLPLSLSYDHRIVDGAAAARFVVYLGELLSDIRRLLL